MKLYSILKTAMKSSIRVFRARTRSLKYYCWKNGNNFKLLSANPTKWSNTLEQFVGNWLT